MNWDNREELVRRIESDLLDSLDEELELEIEDRTGALSAVTGGMDVPLESHAQRVAYFKELFRVCRHYIVWGCN